MDNATQQPQIPDAVQDAVLKRIAYVLTDEDVKTIERLDVEDPSGNATQYFLMSRVPNFAGIMKEEIESYKKKTS